MAVISSIKARQIIDSRGYPTIEGKLTLDNGKEVTTSIPAGTTVGKYEALELRDNDPAHFDGKGVSKAVSYINDLLAPKLIGLSPLKQKEIDYWLIKADATPNKSRLGANTTLTISQLIAKAGAADSGLHLFEYINQLYTSLYKTTIELKKVPTPIFNIINGGTQASNNLDFQEFQAIPSSSLSFTDAYAMGVDLFHELKRVLQYRNANVAVGEEGGFAPDFSANVDALEVINETFNRKNLKVGFNVFLGLDIASPNFFVNDKYVLKDRPHPLKIAEYMDFLRNITKTYSLLIIEDPFSEDDWASWKKLNAEISDKIYVVGDDLITTNKERFKKAIQEKACSTVLIKPNQIGTIDEVFEVVDLARKNNFNYIVSHRSGETNDTFLADLGVGIQADFVKFGGPTRGERVEKYNRLLQIEQDELNK